MSTTYHERFADALRKTLPRGFEVHADEMICTAYYGTAALVGFTPEPIQGDKRKPIQWPDVEMWIQRASSRLRSQMQHYTPEAKEAATALLDRLAPAKEEIPA